MDSSFLDFRCPYCGGVLEDSPNQGGYEELKCENCGHVFYVEDEKSRKKLFSLHAFQNTVINLLHAKTDGGKTERIAMWKQHEELLEGYIEQCGGEGNQDPLFAIARAAYITDGFEHYPSKAQKEIAEELYMIALRYVEQNDKAIHIQALLNLYRKKLRSKKRKKLLSVLGGIVAVIAFVCMVFFVILGQYVCALTDARTGASVTIPKDAISLFDKLNVDFIAEKQKHNMAPYLDAKKVLQDETEKFELFDLTLKNNDKIVQISNSVTVEIPIPDGYDIGALTVYHIRSDNAYKKVSATVSAEKNTISFTTSHFSYYAIAERHPIVTFDSDGGTAIPRQIVKRDTWIQLPEIPQKMGYTFGGWINGTEIWNFATNTVTDDIMLKAQWIPNQYKICFETNGGTQIESQNYTYETITKVPQNPIREGYEFAGWTFDCQDFNFGKLMPAQNITATAKWNRQYKIYFETNGGTQIASRSYTYNAITKAPSNPVREGYDFVGWLFNDADFSFGNSMPTQDIMATAQWRPKTVFYDSQNIRGTYIIKDDGPATNGNDKLNLSDIEVFMTSNYKLKFKIEILMKEKNKGYQEFYLSKSDKYNHVKKQTGYEYAGTSLGESYGWVTFEWTVEASSCTSTMYLQYNADGGMADDWYCARAKVTVTVIEK